MQRKYFIGLVCLVLGLSVCYSQSLPLPSEMTDAQIIAELMSNLEKRETSITEQEAQLKLDKASLEREKSLLAQDKTIFESRKLLQTETETYWKNSKSDSLKTDLAIGAISFLAGFGLGNFTGFKLGITVQY